MHNKHAEEAVRTLKDFVNDHNETVRWLRNQNPDDVAEALASALHSAVQKEREEFAEAIKQEIHKDITEDAKYDIIIDRIKSDREKGE